MKEVLVNLDNDFWLLLETYGELGRDKTINIL
jgi:hypothetical protein